MKAAFKWRLQNGLYGYITDESGNGEPFAYDIAQQSRIYSGGTVIPEYPVDEGAISTSVSRMAKQTYTDAFNKFKQFINSKYPQVSLLDVIYYYNIENDECTASATSLKCSATDIIFEATAVSGDTLSVTVDNEQSRPDEGDALKYRLDFVFPIDGGGGANTNRAVRVNGNVFIQSGDTTTPLNLSAGTNITLTTGASGTVTIKATDTNTWRPVRVNGRDFISSDSTTSLELSAGTNVTLITGSSGTIGIEVSDSWRPVMVDGDVFLTGTTNPLKLSACTNVTLITGDSGTVGIAAKDSWRIIKVNDHNFITDGTTPLNLSAGTNVTLITGSSGTVGIKAEDTWRKIKVNGVDFLGSETTTSTLNLSAGTNVTLTPNSTTGVVTIKADNSTYSQGRNITIDSNNKVNAEGYTYVSGSTPSFAITGNTATGKYSFAEGSGTTAYGDASHAGGLGTTASGIAQTVVGQYNEANSEALFIVGNGTEQNRNNAIEVYKDNKYDSLGIGIYGLLGIVDSYHSPGVEWYYDLYGNNGIMINKKSQIIKDITYGGKTYTCYVYILYPPIEYDDNIAFSAGTFSSGECVCVINRSDINSGHGGGMVSVHYNRGNSWENISHGRFSVYKILNPLSDRGRVCFKYADGPEIYPCIHEYELLKNSRNETILSNEKISDYDLYVV